MTVWLRNPETNAVLAALTTGGLNVGDGVRPVNTSMPYVVVYPSITPTIDGTTATPDSDVESEYLVRGVGQTRESAQIVLDKARVLLQGRKLTITGRSQMQPIRYRLAQQVERDDDTSPPLFTGADLYSITTTPA